MKLFILTVFIATSASAYHSGMEKNHPVREPVVKSEVRTPASTPTLKETLKTRK